MTNLAERIAALPPEKRAALAQMLKQQQHYISFPLSFAQERLWLLDQLDPGRAIYNIPAVVRIVGPFSAEAVEWALNRLVERHESLRTVFVQSGDRPIQHVLPMMNVVLEQQDLRPLPEPDRESDALRRVELVTQQLFDLAQGPLLRALLLRMGDQEYLLALVMHHIISDAWSMGVLVRELSALCRVYAGAGPELPSLPIQYGDFARWQRETLQGERLEELLSTWRARLDGAPTFLPLPTDRPRSPVHTFSGAKQTRMLSAELTEALHALSRANEATLFMTLLAAFAVWLQRLSGQTDLVIGTPIANRTRHEIEGLIGFFVNTLALRVSLHGNPTFREALADVRSMALEAYANQDLPFELLVQELKVERDHGHTPLIQVMFALQNAPNEPLTLSDLTIQQVPISTGLAKFDLTVTLAESKQGLQATFEYKSDLFDDTTMTCWLDQYATVLQSVVDHPDRRIADLSLLSDRQRQQILVEWNTTRRPYPALSIHACFAEQAAATPDAAALVDGMSVLSYAELNCRANQLAHHLRTLGVTHETRVGIFFEHTVELVIAILAVLKAGGTYTPLDPTYPRSRIEFMLCDADVAVILTQSALLDRLPAHDQPVVCLDSDLAAFRTAPVHNPPDNTDSQQLAYVMYTSGSTGTPKGIGVPHRAVMRLVHNTNYVQFGPDKRFLQASNSAFDAATFEIWGALLHGATLVLVERETLLEPQQLARVLREQQITTLFLTVALFNRLISEQPAAFATAHDVLVGGQALDPHSIGLALAAGPPRRLLNGYGPTESTTFAAWYEIRNVPPGATAIPIGYPLANTQLYVLDTAGRPVPVGVPGELFIGGDGLARGYVNRPDLTAERFIPHPFSDTPGERLYRTGDLTRYRADGAIEFLGRIDEQVKIRGFRIEPDEVAMTLRQYAAVREAVVVVREDTTGDRHLVAYLVPTDAQPDTRFVADTRAFLAERLPAYMIPAAFVLLDRLPLTPNGKVDRAALPAPELQYAAQALQAETGSTPSQELLSHIWCELLNREYVGPEDNFFEIGGHSLLATQVVARVRDMFGVEVSLRQMFDAPTIAAMADTIERARRAERGVEIPPLRRAEPGQMLPLSFAQQRLWFLDQLEPGNSAYSISEAIRLSGPLEPMGLEQILQQIIARHAALRTTFVTVDGRAVQQVATDSNFALETADFSSFSEPERSRRLHAFAVEEARRPFDLAAGPLFRATLVRLGEDEHALLLTMHHIISDGWSMGVLVREIGILLNALVSEEPPQLAELPIQYTDFAVWQRNWLQGAVLEAQLSYWRARLGDKPAPLNLPTDRPRPAVQSYRGARHSFQLSPELTSALRRVSRQHGTTLFMTVLAAFKTLLYRYSGHTDILVGTPIANRTRSELEGLIGFFVNTLVLRTNLGGNPTFQELLARVRETTLEAYDHQDLPFEKLVHDLQIERNLSHTPLFQVLFALQNMPSSQIDLPGITLQPLDIDNGSAKFDVSLVMNDTPQGLKGSLEYNKDLFDQTTAVAMADHLGTLLEGAAADPGTRIGELPLLREAEPQPASRSRPVAATNTTGSCLHERFEAQVARRPNAVALVHESRPMRYRELNQRANALAHRLRALGVGTHAEVCVGLCVERSPDILIGILGILKAGGAYVPLDPTYPSSRLAFMLNDSQASVLVTQSALRDQLPTNGLPVICLDTDISPEEIARSENLSHNGSADNLAYVIYTSGSTGMPKAVQVTHANVTRLFDMTQDWFQFDATDIWTLFHSYAFDFSVWEIWGALLYGGQVIVVPYLVSRSPESFFELVRDAGVTILNQTPSAFRQFIPIAETSGTPGDLSLRLVIFGGEALNIASLRPWFERFGDQQPQLVNMYGITETTVHVTYRPLHINDLGDGVGSMIGDPIPDLQVYLLDQFLHPVPTGVPGEIYVAGAGLARGYLNQAALTAQRFVPDPFGDVPGARMYRTGDIARRRADGDLEHLGRADDQVKIRGFRIELGEIETLLGQHPAVRECAVVARADTPPVGGHPEKRLIAYVVAEPGARATLGPANQALPQDRQPIAARGAQDVDLGTELRQYLKERLPDYMTPAVFVMLDALPLTQNGKLDRAALPAPDHVRSDLQKTVAAPQTQVEQLLASIWSEVLGITPIGIHDNFFELGGDSILSIQVVSKAAQSGIQITPKQMFQHQTIADLASVARSTISVQAEQGLVTGPVPLLPIQHWFFERNLPDPHHYNQAFLLRLWPLVHAGWMEQAIGALVAHHDALRMRFTNTGTQWQQVNADIDERLPFELFDISALPAAEQSAAIEATAARLQQSLSLSDGPLLRVALFDLGSDQPARLLMIIHHLVVDGVSWRVLMADLRQAYEQLSQGQPVQLPPKTTSYKQWAEQLVAYTQSGALTQELDYWLSDHRRQADATILPIDNWEGVEHNTYASAATVSLALAEDETRALLHDVPKAYHTQINDVLLAGLGLAWVRWAGVRMLLLNLEGHGREDLFDGIDLSRTVGWFTTIFPVVLDLHADDPGEMLKSLKEQLRAVPGRGIGYGMLRYLTDDQHQQWRLMPQARVSFNYLGRFDQQRDESVPFGPAPESSGPLHSPNANRSHLLDVSGNITRDQLHMHITYSTRVHRRESIETLMNHYATALREIIRHSQSPDAGGFTPSDFGLTNLTQQQIDKILRKRNRSK